MSGVGVDIMDLPVDIKNQLISSMLMSLGASKGGSHSNTLIFKVYLTV